MPDETPTPHADDEQPWGRRADESNLWYSRFDAYLKQGPMRSVRETYRLEKHAEKSRSVPASWTEKSRAYGWKARADAYDAWQRRTVFTKGNAADTERVTKLDKVIDGLFERVEHMLEKAPQYDEKFNGFLVDRLFAALDLMAKHTGGYVERHEHTGRDGGAIEVEGSVAHNVVFYLPEVEALPGMDALDALDAPPPSSQEGHSDATPNP